MPETSLFTTARRTFHLLGCAALVVAALYGKPLCDLAGHACISST